MERQHQYEQCWKHDELKIIECQTCGFKHLYPIPNQEMLEQFYREDYYQRIKPVEEHWRNVNPVEWYQEVQCNKAYGDIFKQVGRLLKTPMKILMDIGCGYNGLTSYFISQGWESYAVEPSRRAGAFLAQSGVNVISSTIETLGLNDLPRVSFVNLQFVLEHLPDPLAMVQKAYNALVPGGILRVVVPNDFSEGQLAYQEHFQESLRWVCIPDHINYFSFSSLSAVLQKNGFQEVYRSTTFPLELLLLAGMNYYKDREVQQKIGPFVRQFEQSLKETGREDLLAAFYENMATMGFGRSILLYVQKHEA